MKGDSTPTLASFGVIVAGLAAVFFLSGVMTAEKPPLPYGYEDEDLVIPAEKLRGFTLGMEGLVADWYWMRSLQYLGDKIIEGQENVAIDDLSDLDPRLLYPLLDSATSMDPHFMAAYSFGAVVLPAIDPNEGVKLVEKGIAGNPSQWRLYQHLGFIYWKMEEFDKAAETYERGAELEGAPPFMRLMAAKMRTEGGSRETARTIYEDMLQSDDTNIRELAALRLLEIAALIETDALQAAVETIRADGRACDSPSFWKNHAERFRGLRTSEGRPLRFDRETGAPLDPTGTPYSIGPDCKVGTAAKRTPSPKR